MKTDALLYNFPSAFQPYIPIIFYLFPSFCTHPMEETDGRDSNTPCNKLNCKRRGSESAVPAIAADHRIVRVISSV